MHAKTNWTHQLFSVADFLGETEESRVYQGLPDGDLRRVDIVLLTVTGNPCECLLFLGIAGDADVSFDVATSLSPSQNIHKGGFPSPAHAHEGCEDARSKSPCYIP